MRIPFLRPKSASAAPERARPPAMGDDPAEVLAARTQARRRLVGAVVLLLIGVVGFPVLFETQPRPLPIDTPIEAPRRDAATPVMAGQLAAPPRLQPLPVLPADAGTEETPASAVAAPVASAPALSRVAPVVMAPAPSVVPPPMPVATTKPATTPASVPAPAPGLAVSKAAAPAPKPAPPPPAAKPAAAPAAAPSTASDKPTAASSAALETGRYVIQAGAYSEAGKLREARAKIEKLGLKTYTQVVESDKGSRTRVRVGPYATRAEAETVAAKVKRSGLPAAVLAL